LSLSLGYALIIHEFMYLGVTMKTALLGAIALACVANFATAQQYGRPANPESGIRFLGKIALQNK
jgi:hypothetical protein